ncbi:hypothetical protein N8310_05460 [Pseudomonadota bacterium]|nr:hypothetical protein [Pseudomonadota bacterium]
MKNFVLIFLTLFSFLSFSNLAYGSDIKLECEFTDYSRSSYKERISKSWLPSIQNFTVKGNYVDASYYRLSNGRIEVNNDKRISWSYKNLKFNNKNGQKRTLKYKFIYFKTNNKIVADIIFTGYRNHTDIMGTCSENISKVSTPLEHDLSDMNEISLCVLAADKGKWSSSNLHSNHIKEAKRRGLTCGVKETTQDKTKVNKKNSFSPYSLLPDKRICDEVTSDAKPEDKYSYVIEAKERGLTCGVVNTEKENRLKLEQEKINKKAKVEEKNIKKSEIRISEKESKDLLFNIKSYAVINKDDLDPLKLGLLFMNLKKSSSDGWNEETLNNYNLLKTFVYSSQKFQSFVEKIKTDKLNKKNAEIKRLTKILQKDLDSLKTFISVNLGSDKSLEALTLADELNKVIKTKDYKLLYNLHNKLKVWKSDNLGSEKSVNKVDNKKNKNIKPKLKINKNLSNKEIIRNALNKNEKMFCMHPRTDGILWIKENGKITADLPAGARTYIIKDKVIEENVWFDLEDPIMGIEVQYSISFGAKKVISNYQNHKDFWERIDCKTPNSNESQKKSDFDQFNEIEDLEISMTCIDDNGKKIIVGKKADIIYEDKDKAPILETDKSGKRFIVKRVYASKLIGRDVKGLIDFKKKRNYGNIKDKSVFDRCY